MKPRQELIFTKSNRKSPHILVPWIFLGGIAIVFGVLGIVRHNQTPLIASVLLLFILGVIYSIGFLARIKINRNGIEFFSPYKTVFIDWKKIKSAGVYRINRYQVAKVNPEDYDKFSLWGQKFIFISTKENFFPAQGQQPPGEYIDFNWRKEAWDLITAYLNEHRT